MLVTSGVFAFVFLASVLVKAQYVSYPGQVPFPYQQQNAFQNVLPPIGGFGGGFPQGNQLSGYGRMQNQFGVYQSLFPQLNPYQMLPQQAQIGGYPAYPQYRQTPFYPIQRPGMVNLPANGLNRTGLAPAIPVEIIDIDEHGNQINYHDEIIDVNEIKPEITTPAEEEDSDEKEQDATTTPEQSTIHPLISGTSIQHYSSNINNNNTKGIQIFESKPINTVIRRTIHSTGRDGRNVLNIHVINGVEVTSEPSVVIYEEVGGKVVGTTTEKEESEEEEDDKNSVDDTDPKPVLGWFN